MEFLREAWAGRVRLSITYWILGVGGNMGFVAVLAGLWIATGGRLKELLILVWVASLVWFVFVFVAIWRAAAVYKGPGSGPYWPARARWSASSGWRRRRGSSWTFEDPSSRGAAMIPVTDTIAIPEEEVSLSFIRAGGPGGQNVNKVASAVQLRFDAANSPSLPDFVRRRLPSVAGSRMTKDGAIVLTADRFRTQEANRRDALERLAELVRRAAVRPKRRVPTRPGAAAKRRRIDAKTRRGATKRLRGQAPRPED